MKNQVPDEIKHKRFQTLLDELYPIFNENNLKYNNKAVEVLVEEISKITQRCLREEREQINWYILKETKIL